MSPLGVAQIHKMSPHSPKRESVYLLTGNMTKTNNHKCAMVCAIDLILYERTFGYMVAQDHLFNRVNSLGHQVLGPSRMEWIGTSFWRLSGPSLKLLAWTISGTFR